MDKKKLQEVTPYKVMTPEECFIALGWTYEKNEKRYDNITCPCGGELEFRGFVGTEVIECQKCKKHMVDLFSPITVSNSACAILDPRDYDYSDNRHWIAIDENALEGLK